MSRAWSIFLEIVSDLTGSLTYFLVSNMRNFANVLSISCPYLMYFLGQYAQSGSFKFIYSTDLIFPIVFAITTYFLHSAANKTGKGNTCPVPVKRFTDVSDDGEVSVENSRLQELILYVADLEDWMERKNIL